MQASGREDHPALGGPRTAKRWGLALALIPWPHLDAIGLMLWCAGSAIDSIGCKGSCSTQSVCVEATLLLVSSVRGPDASTSSTPRR